MKKICSLLLAVVFTLGFATTAYAAAVPITKDQYYARSTLKNNELKFYDAVYDGIVEMDTTILVSKYGISKDRVNSLIYMIYNDTPELFYKNIYWKWRYNENNIITQINIAYDYSSKEAGQLSSQLQQRSQEILSQINDSMTSYEKVKTIYLWLGKNIEYDHVADNDLLSGKNSKTVSDSQSIVGGLINQKAICAGISRSLQYLLYQIGIPCYTVDGHLNGESHTWNLLQIDGQWYQADLTKDLDAIKNNALNCFLWDDTMLIDHNIDMDENPSIPACTSTKYVDNPQITPGPNTEGKGPVWQPTGVEDEIAKQQSASPKPTSTPVESATPQMTGTPVITAAAAAIIIVAIVRRKKK